MKYKDLQVGDWFTPKGKSTPYIRVQTNSGNLYDLCFDDSARFGECFPLGKNPDFEVEFLSELNIINPFFINHEYFFNEVPLCQFFQVNRSKLNPLLLFKTYIEEQNHIMFLNSENYSGQLSKGIVSECKVLTVEKISISFPENRD